MRHLWPLLLIPIPILVGGGSVTGILDAGDRFIEDRRARLALRPASGQVAVVAIDARSLDEVGVWPWPRQAHARLIRRLLDAGVNEIALDIDFSQPGPGEGDAALRAALAAADGAVVLPAFVQPASATAGDVVVSRPIEAFASVSWEGLVNVVADAGGQIRGVAGGIVFGAEILPSMAELFAGTPPPRGGDVLIDFSIDPRTIPQISAADILAGTADPSALAGRKVIVGATAVELGDNFAVPVHRVLTGPLVQAMAVESLIQGRVVTHPPPLARIAVIGLLAVALALVFWRQPFGRQIIAGLGTVAVIEGLAFAVRGAWAITVPTFAIHLSVAVFLLAAIVRELNERRLFGLFATLRGKNRERLLERIMQDSFDGIIIVGASETILRINPAARRILHGDTGLRLIGWSLADALPSAISGQVLAAFRLVSRDPDRPLNVREICVTENGAITCYLEIVVTRSAMEGEEGEVFAITLRNVTERRQSELDTEALAQEALRAVRARSTFIFALAHELRGPLEAIAGLASLVGAPGQQLPHETTVNHARIIAESARNLLSMADDVGDLSRIEKGDLELALEPVGIGQLFGDLSALFPVPQLLIGRDIRFEAGDAAACIRCDRRRLRQALVNLVTGMIGRVPREGTIIVSARSAAGRVSISVAADGPHAKAADDLGVEFGLAIVEGLVKAHGGRVTMRDAAAGLSVVIDLPLENRDLVAEAA